MVFLSFIKIRFQYFRLNEDDIVSIEFFLWGVFHHKVEIPVLMLRQKMAGFSLISRTELETGQGTPQEIMSRENHITVTSVQQLLDKLHKWLSWLQVVQEDIDFFLEHLVLERFYWRISFGTTDAAATGMLAGLAWSLAGVVTALFYHKIAPSRVQPVIKVEPDFEKAGFATSADCIFKIRIGYIMVTGLKILKKKANRQGVNFLGRTSHRRSHENCHGKY
ncbi:MAG: DUF2953 domain-containing protein [Firmicutes bacterium]|nr:DUF2953 domain-containing protein [Bacillota bacterium]